jgi:hypothetical protein
MRRNVVALGAVAAVAGAWLFLVARQVADGGFYSDDYGVQWDWAHDGYWGAVDTQFDALGSKPLLAFALPAPYTVFGSDPTGHHVLAAALVLATVVAFYFVLRGLRFGALDATAIALLALLFPWASGVRLWPTGSLNNLAVILLFAGLLVALRGLRVAGPRGYLIHLAASALYAASVLTYDATTVVAAMLWPAYVWLRGWRPALPRALMDLAAVGAAAVYTADHTNKHVADFSDQLAHVPEILREGADLIAASLVPASVPAEFPAALTAGVLTAAAAVLAIAALRGRASPGGGSREGLRWVAVAAVSLAALALCWAIYIPQAFYTPTFRGLEDRVNVLALYPAVVLVWAVLRSAGGLISRNGYPVAVAAAFAIVIGYAIQDGRQERDWAEAAEHQELVLEAVDRASPPEGSLVLTFDHPAETAPGVPVFNASWDLHPAAQLLGRAIHTYPVFEGARLKCSAESLTVQRLPTPLYRVIHLDQRGTPRTFPYSRVVFVDAETERHAVIRTREQCLDALSSYPPGPWRD